MSSIQFYTDDNCLDLGTLGSSTGPSNGLCTQFGESAFKSFRVVTLQRTCAVTIYGSDVAYCSSTNIGLASFGACMKNTTVNQFSVDCQDFQIANSDSPASYVSPAATGTGSSSTATASPSSSAVSADDGLSTGAKAGIGASIALLVIAAMALGNLLRVSTAADNKSSHASIGSGRSRIRATNGRASRRSPESPRSTPRLFSGHRGEQERRVLAKAAQSAECCAGGSAW